jgi:broad specificity phosphatase PhoE
MLSSIEPKARETAELVAGRLGIPANVAQGLHEHERTTTRYVGEREFKTAVAGLFARPGELVYGEETGDQARERFDAGVRAALEDRQAENVVIVAHGTVISLFVSAVAGVDAMALWESIGMPSYVVLGRPELELLEIVESM